MNAAVMDVPSDNKQADGFDSVMAKWEGEAMWSKFT